MIEKQGWPLIQAAVATSSKFFHYLNTHELQHEIYLKLKNNNKKKKNKKPSNVADIQFRWDSEYSHME